MLDGLGRFLWLLVRVLCRYFVTGQSLLGRPTDNATFFYAATTDMRGKPYERLSGPIWQRLARRWAALGVPLLFLEMSVVARVAQEIYPVDPAWVLVGWRAMAFRWWVAAALGLAIRYGYKFVRYAQTREQVNDFVYPAWEAACDAMGYKFRQSDARRMVVLPDAFKEPGAPEKRHGWTTAWFYRWRERRQQARDLAAAQAETDMSEEPDTVEPSTELVVRPDTAMEPYKEPPWARLRRRHGSHAEDEADPVVIHLPPGKCATTAEKNRLIQKVGPRLGMPDALPTWDRRMRYVELRPALQPPPEFTFAEFRKHLNHPDVDIDHIPVGLSHGGRLEFINFIDDTAHLLVSAESGRGKSNFIKGLCAILMWLGCQMVVLDRKLISHRWAHNLPGCNYAWRLESTDLEPGIHDLLIAIGAEIDRRKSNAIPVGADVDTPLNKFPTLVILVEEQNVLSEQLRDYWTSIRRPGDPAQSPAFTALREAIYTGREFGVRIISVAQRGDTNVFGANGGAARESFSTRVLGGWTPQAWKMLARGLRFILCPPGRGIFSIIQSDGRAPIIRSPLWTDREARDLAMSGVPSPGQPIANTVVVDEAGTVVEQVTPTEPITPELVDLRAVVEGNMLPGPHITWEALRKAPRRDRRFPKPAGMLGVAAGYRLSELVEWKNVRDGVSSPLALDGERRPGAIYLFRTLETKPDGVELTGEIEIGYIGKTRRFPITIRANEHRGWQAWGDLTVGDPIIIWQSDACTDEELSAAEQAAIEREQPRYNYEFQEGAPHAMTKWDQEAQRQARNRAAGLPPWEPENRYEMSQLAQLSHAGTG